jgi:anti-anti-sigma regulatory factor
MHAEPSDESPILIELSGTFDVPAAQRLAHALAAADRGRTVRVDLTHVREFHDFGVAVLAQALAGRSHRVAVRGLRQHQLRLLRYLGLEGVAATA